MAQMEAELLREALAARNRAVVTAYAPDGARHGRTRLLRGDARTITLGVPAGFVPKAPMTLSLRAGGRRLTFAAVPVAAGAASAAGEITIACPTDFRLPQRRNAHRVTVPQVAPGPKALTGAAPVPLVVVRAWRMGPWDRLHVDRPLPSQRLQADLIDVSAGGAGLALQLAPRGAGQVRRNERVRVELECEQTSVLLEGTVRWIRADARTGQVRAGLRVTMRDTFESRVAANAVDRIIARLRREEARQVRAAG